MNWQILMLSTNGRSSRKDYWAGVVALVAAWVLSHLLHVFAPIIWILLIYPWVCVYAKRLHDFGKSAWLMLIPFAVIAVCVVMALIFGGASAIAMMIAIGQGGSEPTSLAAFAGGIGAMMVLLGIAALAKLAFLIWVGVTPGDPGRQRLWPRARLGQRAGGLEPPRAQRRRPRQGLGDLGL
ncbi:MAG: DUF805 domain-containing protein [Caulobacteraceae bacterium]